LTERVLAGQREMGEAKTYRGLGELGDGAGDPMLKAGGSAVKGGGGGKWNRNVPLKGCNGQELTPNWGAGQEVASGKRQGA